MVAHACHPSTQKATVGGCGIWSHSQLHRRVEDTLDYTRLHLRTKTNKQKTRNVSWQRKTGNLFPPGHHVTNDMYKKSLGENRSGGCYVNNL